MKNISFKTNISSEVLQSSFPEGGIPFVCGGDSNFESALVYNDGCYKYEAANDEWINSGALSEGRRTFSGYGSSESWGLVMAGGFGDGGGVDSLSSVETTYNGETFASLPDIPQSNRESCIVIIDDDRIFMCGGGSTDLDTQIFTNSTNSWQRYKYSQLGKRPHNNIYINLLSAWPRCQGQGGLTPAVDLSFTLIGVQNWLLLEGFLMVFLMKY